MPPVEVIENEPDFVPEQISNFVVVPVTVQPKVCVAFASFEPTALNPIPPTSMAIIDALEPFNLPLAFPIIDSFDRVTCTFSNLVIGGSPLNVTY